jgi:hypothetical protein
MNKQNIKPDHIVDGGILKINPPSKVVDISNLSEISVLRN